MRTSIVVLTLAAALLAPTAHANLLQNPGFSEWSGIYPVGWFVEDTTKARVERSTDPVRSAPAAVKITRMIDGTGTNYGVKQLAPITGGQEYTLAAYVFDNDDNAGAGIGISWRQADTSYISHSGTTYGDSAIRTWQRVFKTATAPSNAVYADCLLRVYGFTGSHAGGIVYFDDASLVLGAGGVAEDPRARPRITLRISPRPNPSSGRVNFEIEVSRSAQVKLDVYDMTGSLVSAVSSGNLAAGRHRLAWNGTDRESRPVANGLYFAVLTGESGEASVSKLVLER